MSSPHLRSILRRFGPERGQVFVLTAIGLTAICGMAGFSIDVASWYQAHRKQQAIADAAAIAAADDLPGSTDQATADAETYASKNGGSLSAAGITYSTKYSANDTVTVTTSATAPSYFLKTVGVGSAAVGATATARAVPLGSAYGAAPFAVYYTQPELTGQDCGTPGTPCWGQSTTLLFNKVGPGGFEIINIDGSSGGTGPSTLSSWVQNGCDCNTTTPVWLWGDPGAKFNSGTVGGALDNRIGSDLLFPVYDLNQANGSNMQYEVIAFVGFKITGYQFNGSNNGKIMGSFQKVMWKGDGAPSSPGAYSATTTQLVG
jgi:Flp pilus assembly protein TadG